MAPKNKTSNATKNNKTNLEKYNIQVLILIGVIITAFCSFLGIVLQQPISSLTSFIISNQTNTITLTNQPISTTEDNSPSGIPTPGIAGEQYNFSPIINVEDFNSLDIPSVLKLNETPFTGIYISGRMGSWGSRNESWVVHYKNGERVYGQSASCLINKDYPEEYQSPMNLKVDTLYPVVSLYIADRYSMEITKAEILLVNYKPQRTDVDFIVPFYPGGGGEDTGRDVLEGFGDLGGGGLGIFFSVLTSQTRMTPEISEYQIDFPWFKLELGEGVNMILPIFMTEPGAYQIQIKIYAIIISTSNSPGEHIELTTGRDTYSWASIDDPRSYDVFDSTKKKKRITLDECP